MMFKNKAQKGFSLVELMIVVGIIGILAALAVPRFSAFQAKARQAEAKTNLGQVYTLQESYFLDKNIYSQVTGYGLNFTSGWDCGTNAIGFAIKPCSSTTGPRYRYAVATGASGTQYTATATSGSQTRNLVVPGCTSADTHQMREDRTISVTLDAVANCN